MKVNKSFTAIVVSLGLLLGACANGDKQAATSESPASSSVASSPAADSSAAPGKATSDSASTQSLQVVDAGAYHLEFAASPEPDGIHLDVFLHTNDSHEDVKDATMTGQVQLPDGSEKEVAFAYDAAGKHYGAMLPATASGEYKVVILTDVKGEKINGRFSFTK